MFLQSCQQLPPQITFWAMLNIRARSGYECRVDAIEVFSSNTYVPLLRMYVQCCLDSTASPPSPTVHHHDYDVTGPAIASENKRPSCVKSVMNNTGCTTTVAEFRPLDARITSRESMITTRYRPKPGCSVVPTFRSVGHFGLPVHFVASPELHGRFKCCPESHSTSTILSTYLAMFCTSATFTATAFPSPSPPCHFLCTSHIPSLTFLPHLLLPPQIPICFPDCFVPILAQLMS
jgi:hypothetical protein